VVDTGRLDAAFCGAEYDAELLARLPPHVCPCGEDGEFHTLVWHAPGFAAPLALRAAAVVLEASRPPLASTTLARLPVSLEHPAPGDTAAPVRDA
jgi:diphthamide synthase (EF-2-diphthine--ammonia ligase)